MDRVSVTDRSPPPVACGTGLLALDVVYAEDRIEPLGRWAGGTFGNVMAILSFLGWDTYPIARLRNDPEASEILSDLQRWKVNTEFISRQTSGTTPIVIEYLRMTADGNATHRFSLRCPACRTHLPAYRPVTADHAKSISLPSPQVFFFDRVSRAALDLAKQCAEKGAIVFFEPIGLGNPSHFKEALQISHIVKFSHDRLASEDVVGDLRGRGLLIETLGDEGLRFARLTKASRRLSWTTQAPYRVRQVQDAAGAGDWCTAGIIHSLGKKGVVGLDRLAKADLSLALRIGQAFGAWNCLFQGPRGGMYRTSVQEFWKGISHIRKKGIANGVSAPQIHAMHQVESNIHRSLCDSCR